jgi:hypothetical protein
MATITIAPGQALERILTLDLVRYLAKFQPD